MKENKTNIKEVIEKALEEVLKKRRETEKEYLEEDEVVIEPFMLLDPELCEELAELHEFKDFNEEVHPEACPSMDDEIENEEPIIDELKENTELSAESLLYIADGIKPLDSDNVVMCTAGGVERILVNGENCNIQKIPLLDLILITPVNLQVADDIFINANISCAEEIELNMLCKTEEKCVLFVSDIGTLMDAGLLTIIINEDKESIVAFTCSASEWRCINTPVNHKELEKIIKGEN